MVAGTEASYIDRANEERKEDSDADERWDAPRERDIYGGREHRVLAREADGREHAAQAP